MRIVQILCFLFIVLGAEAQHTNTFAVSNKQTLCTNEFGEVLLTGNWKHYHFNEKSNQHLFSLKGKKHTKCAVLSSPKESFQYYDKTLSNQHFIELYYLYQSKLAEKVEGLNVRLIKNDKEDYMIFMSEFKGKSPSVLLLYAVDDNYHLVMLESRDWSMEEQVDFLIATFKNNVSVTLTSID